jgi:hypothetical protein
VLVKLTTVQDTKFLHHPCQELSGFIFRLNSGKVIARLNAEIVLIFDAKSGNLLNTWIDKDLRLVESLGPFEQPLKVYFQRSSSFVSKSIESLTTDQFETAEETVIDLSLIQTGGSRVLFGCIIHGLFVCVVQEDPAKDPTLQIFDPNSTPGDNFINILQAAFSYEIGICCFLCTCTVSVCTECVTGLDQQGKIVIF